MHRTAMRAPFSSALSAQAPSTFVVDLQNGVGAQVSEIATAIAAVPEGSILLVRPGGYAAVNIDAKGTTTPCGLVELSNPKCDRRALMPRVGGSNRPRRPLLHPSIGGAHGAGGSNRLRSTNSRSPP